MPHIEKNNIKVSNEIPYMDKDNFKVSNDVPYMEVPHMDKDNFKVSNDVPHMDEDNFKLSNDVTHTYTWIRTKKRTLGHLDSYRLGQHPKQVNRISVPHAVLFIFGSIFHFDPDPDP